MHTFDRRDRVAQAIAVRGGRIVGTGSTREIRRLAGRGTRVIDLEGRAALPGINGAHVHGLAAGLALPPLSLDVSFPAVNSIAEVGAAARRAAASAGGNVDPRQRLELALLDETRADPSRLPTRQDLDAVGPTIPSSCATSPSTPCG